MQFLISKRLIENHIISHYDFDSLNNFLAEYDKLNESIKNLKSISSRNS